MAAYQRQKYVLSRSVTKALIRTPSTLWWICLLLLGVIELSVCVCVCARARLRAPHACVCLFVRVRACASRVCVCVCVKTDVKKA